MKYSLPVIKYKNLLLIILFLYYFMFTSQRVFAITRSPLRFPIRQNAYVLPTRRPLRPRLTPTPSLENKIISTVGPAFLGSIGVVSGAAIAWYTLRKKNKTFISYYERIAQIQKRYDQILQNQTIDNTVAFNSLKRDLIQIQEEAELTAARKKLDQEQLTAIINKIDRILKDIKK